MHGFSLLLWTCLLPRWTAGSPPPNTTASSSTPSTTNFKPAVLNTIGSDPIQVGDPFQMSFKPDDLFYDENPNDDLTISTFEDGSEALPEWLHFNRDTFSFYGEPGLDDARNYWIVIRACDPGNKCVSVVFSLRVLAREDPDGIEQSGTNGDKGLSSSMVVMIVLMAVLFILLCLLFAVCAMHLHLALKRHKMKEAELDLALGITAMPMDMADGSRRSYHHYGQSSFGGASYAAGNSLTNVHSMVMSHSGKPVYHHRSGPSHTVYETDEMVGKRADSQLALVSPFSGGSRNGKAVSPQKKVKKKSQTKLNPNDLASADPSSSANGGSSGSPSKNDSVNGGAVSGDPDYIQRKKKSSKKKKKKKGKKNRESETDSMPSSSSSHGKRKLAPRDSSHLSSSSSSDFSSSLSSSSSGDKRKKRHASRKKTKKSKKKKKTRKKAAKVKKKNSKKTMNHLNVSPPQKKHPERSSSSGETQPPVPGLKINLKGHQLQLKERTRSQGKKGRVEKNPFTKSPVGGGIVPGSGSPSSAMAAMNRPSLGKTNSMGSDITAMTGLSVVSEENPLEDERTPVGQVMTADGQKNPDSNEKGRRPSLSNMSMV